LIGTAILTEEFIWQSSFDHISAKVKYQIELKLHVRVKQYQIGHPSII
jgi:hypothetical protein